jgi:hypothetical protein
VGTIDHFFPLSRPALPSAPDKKIVFWRQLADLCVKGFQIHWRLIYRRVRRAEHIGRSLLVSGDLSAHGALRLDSAGCVH